VQDLVHYCSLHLRDGQRLTGEGQFSQHPRMWQGHGRDSGSSSNWHWPTCVYVIASISMRIAGCESLCREGRLVKDIHSHSQVPSIDIDEDYCSEVGHLVLSEGTHSEEEHVRFLNTQPLAQIQVVTETFGWTASQSCTQIGGEDGANHFGCVCVH
jgi:hypothetical protein